MKSLLDQTLYEILEVPPGAPSADIEAAYERVHSLYAPGSLATYALMSPEEADLLSRRIEEARKTLLDAGARARYDEALASGAPPATLQANGSARAAASPPPAIAAASPAQAEEPPRVPAGRAASAARPASPAGAGTAARRPILLEREIPAEVPAPRPPASPAPRALEQPIPEVLEWTGEALRLAREARGITVKQVAERTKVTRHHIENIEGDRFGALPAPVYLRGILLAIARELRLDGQRVARSYLGRAAGTQPAPPPVKVR